MHTEVEFGILKVQAGAPKKKVEKCTHTVYCGDRNRRSTMEFLVRWDDFTGAESWEPYAGLRHAEKLHEYLEYIRCDR